MVADLPPAGAAPALHRIREASPTGVNVRSRVHEYGGGEYTVHRDRVYLVDDADGGLHVAPIGGAARPVCVSGSLHAEPVVSPDGRWLLAIEERPRTGAEPENRILAVALDVEGRAAGPPRVVAAGHDFYASIRFSPAGDEVAFLAWDHPGMPWNGTWLETLAWGPEGPRGGVRPRAGGRGESLFQPDHLPDGGLLVVSDRSGFWNLARVTHDGAVPIHRDAFEIGRPQWVFGLSTWAPVSGPDADRSGDGAGGRVLAAATRAGVDGLVEIELAEGRVRERPSPLRSIAGLVSGEGWAACVGGAADRAAALYLWRVDDGAPVPVLESSPMALADDVISRAEPVTLPSVDGRATHAFLYRPRSAGQTPRPGERPPLLVKSHGGPTAAASAALDPRIQFWTSRGFAVADVNYGGSTGFGRAYRDQLHERWGIVDVEDCVAVARALADEGVVDGARLAISGGSAGGYTTLCGLTFHDAFAAGASHYGIGDLEALARDTHKFESRYTDWLVGPLPQTLARYRARSPIHHVDRLACPVIFFQGLEDRVVPPSQAEAMVAALAARGLSHAYVPFPGEQHGFRRAENIRTALDGELYFYARLFGFDAPRPPGVDVLEGRA
jgi:dipeptidyl aminopeptidase/acylaminoacyl peptidase